MALLQMVLEALVAAQTEIIIFVLAMCAHAVFFGLYRINPAKSKAKRVPGTAPGAATKRCTDSPRRVALLKKMSSEQRLGDAMKVFEASPEKTAALYNALLDACIECKDIAAAEKVMAEATSVKAADVVTYNTMIKLYAQNGDVAQMRNTIASMRATGGGLAPNSVTFNELMDLTIQTNPKAAWGIIDEMTACGLKPTSVTCSILLKTIQGGSRAADVQRVLAFVDSMPNVMDEVLLSSMCMACIRCDRLDLIANRLQLQKAGRGVQLNGAHSIGSVIRAYGMMQDVDGVWRTWNQMRAQKIVPTSITAGCMVEALVQNGDPESGHALIRQLLAEPQCRPLVNAIMYCSVLKGFCHQRSYDRVWALYEELRAEKLELSIVTYNALIDACARSRDMKRVEPLLKEMSSAGIEPNLVTLSTVLKGYCQEGQMDKAFALLEDMKKSPAFQPDEITYNTIIDGCARSGLCQQGMSVLEEMMEAGVPPSAFTLSVIVKLMVRSHKTQEALALCDKLAHQYRIKMNIYVYNNLLHGYLGKRDAGQAFEVLQRMLREDVRPDSRTYTLMLRCCVHAGAAKEVEGLLRAAAGLPGAEPRLLAAVRGPASLQPRGEMPTYIVTEAIEALAGPLGFEVQAIQLVRELQRSCSSVRVEQWLLRRLVAKASTSGR